MHLFWWKMTVMAVRRLMLKDLGVIQFREWRKDWGYCKKEGPDCSNYGEWGENWPLRGSVRDFKGWEKSREERNPWGKDTPDKRKWEGDWKRTDKDCSSDPQCWFATRILHLLFLGRCEPVQATQVCWMTNGEWTRSEGDFQGQVGATWLFVFKMPITKSITII